MGRARPGGIWTVPATIPSVNEAPTGTVALVGAGPGHPGLITVRAVELLRRAAVVVYDRLVAPGLLDYAPPAAERVCVTELGPCHAERMAPIHDALIAAARQGKRVVRLKGGDPLLFGRGGEEAEALARAGIPFEIVPGVTAALGAAAFAGIPLTHRACASGVAIVTGHEQPGKPETALDWAALARFPGTLILYMGMSRLGHIAQTLIREGMDRATPAAAIQWASLGGQRTVRATLAELAQVVRDAGLSAPAVVIIGPVVDLREQLAWFERLPLFGKRVLVTRPRQQSAVLVDKLIELGAAPVVLPTVEIREPSDWRPVDAALRRLREFHWLVFTSANGVDMFLSRLRHIGLDLRALGSLKIAAIGPKTAEELRQRGLAPDLVPPRFQSEHLAEALSAAVTPGQRVLLARADRGRELLREELSRRAEVEQVAVYSQVDAVEMDTAVVQRLRQGEIDYVTLTSANIARSLLERLDEGTLARIREGQTRLVTISPVTSAAVRALALPVAAEAPEATIDGILTALVKDASRE
jgi:uroporphyrinogen III methyltransferase / synthase